MNDDAKDLSRNKPAPDEHFIQDSQWLHEALQLARRAPHNCVYAVGCIIIGSKQQIIATGFTGECHYTGDMPGHSLPHAEEMALSKVIDDKLLIGATLYSTLEPCSQRRSGRKSCTARILERGITRVVYGAHEPYNQALDIVCEGDSTLKQNGVEVVRIVSTAAECLRVAIKADRS